MDNLLLAFSDVQSRPKVGLAPRNGHGATSYLSPLSGGEGKSDLGPPGQLLTKGGSWPIPEELRAARQQNGADEGPLRHPPPRFVISMRRFSAPNGSLGFFSRDFPYPTAIRSSLGMPKFSVRNCFTASARRSDKSRVYAPPPRASVCPAMRNTFPFKAGSVRAVPSFLSADLLDDKISAVLYAKRISRSIFGFSIPETIGGVGVLSACWRVLSVRIRSMKRCSSTLPGRNSRELRGTGFNAFRSSSSVGPCWANEGAGAWPSRRASREGWAIAPKASVTLVNAAARCRHQATSKILRHLSRGREQRDAAHQALKRFRLRL